MLNWINKRKNRKGFTLVELIVVIAIIGILAAIAIPRFGGFTAGAKEGKVEANHRILVSAAQLYYANTNEWPEDLDDSLINGGYLEEDFNQDSGVTYDIEIYDIENTETKGCKITAKFNGKVWEWNSEEGFKERGEPEKKDENGE